MSSLRAIPTDPTLALDPLPLHLPPDLLKARLAALIRTAVTQGASTVAEVVAQHFQTLSLHPALATDLDERLAYCRGARHWRGLALLGAQAAQHDAGRIPAGAL